MMPTLASARIYAEKEQIIPSSQADAHMATFHTNTTKKKQRKLNKLFMPCLKLMVLILAGLVCYTMSVNNAHLLNKPDATIIKIKRLVVHDMSVTKSNAGKQFAIQVYQSNGIVSRSILRAGWEVDKIKQFNSIFTSYSAKHGIPLSKLTFIDIGANVGWFSLNLAALGVQVLAFEPMHENIDLIKTSLAMPLNVQSGISDRITLYPHGLGMRDKTCIIYSHNTNVGDGHVKRVKTERELFMPENYAERARIPVHRLDDVLHDYLIQSKGKQQQQHLVAIKIDVDRG